MILYIIRHADPNYEKDTITDFGQQEANALADWLRNVKIDRIYSSPLGRALDTAAPTCKIKGMEPIILPWAAETMDYMESIFFTPDSDCTYSFSIQKGVYDFRDAATRSRMATIDTMIENSDRLLASLGYEREGGIFYKVTKHNEDAIAVFCHGGFGCAWIAHLLGLPPALMWPSIKLTTTSITTIHFVDSPTGYIRPRLWHLGEVDHIRRAGLKINPR